MAAKRTPVEANSKESDLNVYPLYTVPATQSGFPIRGGVCRTCGWPIWHPTMKYGIALFISLVLVVGMFAFRAYMIGKVEVWMTLNVTINPFEKLLCQIAFAIGSYWYAFVPTIALIFIGAAAMIPDRRENDQSA